jgi:hypothetical protein
MLHAPVECQGDLDSCSDFLAVPVIRWINAGQQGNYSQVNAADEAAGVYSLLRWRESKVKYHALSPADRVVSAVAFFVITFND